MSDVDVGMRYVAAENARPALMRGSSWFRLGAVALMWVSIVPVIAAGGLWAIPLVAVTTASAALSWMHARPRILRKLDGRGGPAVDRIVDHLLDSYGHVRFDAAGAAETIGALCAMTSVALAAGQLLVSPGWIAMGLIAVSLYAVGALFNVATDSGNYAVDPPPSRLMLTLTMAESLVAAVLGYIYIFVWPGFPMVEFPLRLLLVALLLLPYTAGWLVTQLLNASAVTTEGLLAGARMVWQAQTHTLVSNPVSLLHGELAQEEPSVDRARYFARSARVALGEIQHLGRRQVDEGEFARLRRGLVIRPSMRSAWTGEGTRCSSDCVSRVGAYRGRGQDLR